MLVVIVLVLVVTTLVVLASYSMSDKDQVPAGARHIHGYLGMAKSRALAERRPVGIRLIPTPQNPPDVPPLPTMVVIDQLQFIHDPGDFADGFVETLLVHPETGVALPPGSPLIGRLVMGPPAGLPYTGFSFGNLPEATVIGGGSVLPGDAIEFHGGGQAARIESSPAVLSALGVTRSVYHPSLTAGAINRTVLVLDRALDHLIQAPNVLTPRSNYRVMRSPRPIPGESPLPFPRNVFIIGADATGYAPPRNSILPPAGVTGNFDILFDPSGRVIGTAAEMYIFWVSDIRSALASPADTNWSLVTLYTRTGATATYPVDQQTGNPYTYAQVGRGAGQ
jgi:hypothetical protein